MLFIISEIFGNNNFSNKLVTVVLFLIFQIITYVRYVYKDNNTCQITQAKWLNQNDLSGRKKSYFIALYIILSVILFFGVAIYLGSRQGGAGLRPDASR